MKPTTTDNPPPFAEKFPLGSIVRPNPLEYLDTAEGHAIIGEIARKEVEALMKDPEWIRRMSALLSPRRLGPGP